MGLTLDTSGAVTAYTRDGSQSVSWLWSDLSPFAQGYIEAALLSLEECWTFIGETCLERHKNRRNAERIAETHKRRHGAPVEVRCPGFSDLAPATLAAMLEDCERFGSFAQGLGIKKLGASEGRNFWIGRSAGSLPGAWGAAFPPLTLYLADDGKVHQRAAP